ncbi:MAG TPA: hypothetical protein VMH87_18745 [Pseudomonadales bacterium]|nr:hypothetical protein [Pseudomonadales bacterium]
MATASSWNAFSTDRRVSEKLSETLRTALGQTAGQEHWQPWKFRVEDQFVELSLGAESGEETVADWRERIIRCGGALQSLKLSMMRQGCLGAVKLFPELDRPSLVARVYFSEGGRGYEPEPMLFDVMTPGRFEPANDLPKLDTVLSLISRTVAGERCWLEIAHCQKSRERLLELARMNEEWLFQISGERNEWPPASATDEQKAARFNGWQKFILGVKLRAPLPASAAGNLLDTPTASSGTFAVLKTKTDDKYGWIAAGQTTTLLLETGRKLDVSCTFFNQVLRKPSVRQELRTSIGHKGFGQAIVQLKTAETSDMAMAPAGRPALPLSYFNAPR